MEDTLRFEGRGQLHVGMFVVCVKGMETCNLALALAELFNLGLALAELLTFGFRLWQNCSSLV